MSLRKKIIKENLLNKDYRILNKPELIQIHWRPIKGKKNRYIEICIPIEKTTYEVKVFNTYYWSLFVSNKEIEIEFECGIKIRETL